MKKIIAFIPGIIFFFHSNAQQGDSLSRKLDEYLISANSINKFNGAALTPSLKGGYSCAHTRFFQQYLTLTRTQSRRDFLFVAPVLSGGYHETRSRVKHDRDRVLQSHGTKCRLSIEARARI